MRSWRSAVLVAAVAVFMLALGVILGSGPLRTALTGQTAAQADALRTQIAQRDAQLEAKDAEIARGQELLAQLVPVATRDRLAGQAVVIVIGPGVEPEALVAVTEALIAAGASLTATARLDDSWLVNEQGAFRGALAEQIIADVGVEDESASVDQILAGALLQALVPESAAQAQTAPDPQDEPLEAAIASQRSEVLSDVLTRAGLVAIDRPASDAAATASPATLAIVLAGDEQDAAERKIAAERLVRLGATFASAGLGTVVVTGVPQADDAGDLVGADASSAKGASVVANGWDTVGPLIVVLAAEEQLRGGGGIYGSTARGALMPPS